MADVDKIVTVTTNGSVLRIRDNPNGNIIGNMANGTAGIHVTQEDNGWYYSPDKGGWFSAQWVTVTQEGAVAQPTPEEQQAAAAAAAAAEAEAAKNRTAAEWAEILSEEEAMQRYQQEAGYESLDASKIITKGMRGIWGAPYQYMDSVDPVLKDTPYGRTFADRIVAKMPLLLMVPGKVNFLRSYEDKTEGSAILMGVINRAAREAMDLTEMATGGSNSVSKYYTFDANLVDYYSCVNAMIKTGSVYAGLQDTIVDIGGGSQKLSEVDWQKCQQESYHASNSKSPEYVGFFVDSESQVNESFSNETTESQLVSTVNEFSSVAKEVNFITGNLTGKEFLDEDKLETVMGNIDSISQKYLGGSQLFKDVASNFATVALGGKLIFPEIWSDSSFSKDFNVNIKLRTPDCDPLSWFMNIYVPLCHLVCFAAPQMSDNPNGIKSPFLVRAAYKGLFNCDLGLVTSLSISKGKEAAWTLDGLPTEVDVSMTIKDLYSMMAITKMEHVPIFVQNTSLTQYIANTCGVNINEPDYKRMVDLYIMLKGESSTLLNFKDKFDLSMQQTITNLGYDFEKLMGDTILKFDNILPSFF